MNLVCALRPEAGALCGSSARRDLCGGRRVTGGPTATKSYPFGIFSLTVTDVPGSYPSLFRCYLPPVLETIFH